MSKPESLLHICIGLPWAMAAQIATLAYVEKFGQDFSISSIKQLVSFSGMEIPTVPLHIFDLADRFLFLITQLHRGTVASKLLP